MKHIELINKIKFEDILLDYKNNKSEIIYDIRLCFPYNIKINDFEFVSTFTYKDNIFYFLYDDFDLKIDNVYYIEKSMDKFIYGLKYKNINFIGNSICELKI
jgi:hypothetical protein